ncbi:fumarylacetoacetase [Arthrobacter sp. PAMC25564]|uniref:fumarylacetoacetase n=1 Tax=Arthrobacter sp. PAMC25564 TaxID=2565366 RepID=UPI0010A24DED|nr:fumarylacetoacetase [Arthrobacter sp. PAMC25564]QCB97964.1 fumarylacetoacetase [Arthrobacter sp. PAMC25564]
MTPTTSAGHLFGPDNLPYGVFSPPGGSPRIGVRLGDDVLDVAALLGDASLATSTLNPFMAQGPERWAEVRAGVMEAVRDEIDPAVSHSLADVRLHLPFDVADYVVFYASEHHATNLGRLFRPDSAPLLPNWKHLPVGYHGRAGTVVVSGTDIARPSGQRKPPADATPTFGPSRRLDIEVELGFVVGVGTPADDPIAPDEFDKHVFGVVVVNDWSARDIQAWEYVPLGPNLGKSFATSISAWVVPFAALQAARIPTTLQQPQVLPHLRASQDWGLDIGFTVEWNGVAVSSPNYRDMYWSPAQMLAHMTSNGASARTGDLFASGTISGPEPDQRGSFIELSWNGAQPVTLNGENRTFLEDGDNVTITATALGASGRRIGLGDVTGTVRPARRPTHE